jgi:hypothetical protein
VPDPKRGEHILGALSSAHSIADTPVPLSSVLWFPQSSTEYHPTVTYTLGVHPSTLFQGGLSSAVLPVRGRGVLKYFSYTFATRPTLAILALPSSTPIHFTQPLPVLDYYQFTTKPFLRLLYKRFIVRLLPRSFLFITPS